MDIYPENDPHDCPGLITWFLVSDGIRAHVYARYQMPKQPGTYTQQELRPIEGMSWRSESPLFGQPHNNTLERIAEIRFVHVIASHLLNAQRQRLFSRLVLIAPPKMLGDLHRLLDPCVLNQVVAELPKRIHHRSACAMDELFEETV